MTGNLIVRDGNYTEAADPKVGMLQADNDSATADVRDLTNVSLYLNQIVDDGNATLTVAKSVDGINWAPVATKAQSDFAAGANVAIELTLSDSNGMALQTKQLRVVLTGKTGNGKYTITVAGGQRNGYR